MSVRTQLAPLGLSGFRYLFYATLGSSLGTLVAGIALAIDVKDRTNSGLWVGAIFVVEFLPTIVIGLTLGPLLDRLQRSSLMVAADLLRAAVFFALPFATSAGQIVVLALLAVTVLAAAAALVQNREAGALPPAGPAVAAGNERPAVATPDEEPAS